MIILKNSNFIFAMNKIYNLLYVFYISIYLLIYDNIVFTFLYISNVVFLISYIVRYLILLFFKMVYLHIWWHYFL